MPQTPPPYANIAGISRADMKDNAQETLVNYDGNARPGELVVDLTTYQLYIGNADGNLNVVSGGGGNGSPGGINKQVQFNDSGAFGGNPNFTFDKAVSNVTVAGNVIANGYSLGIGLNQFSYSNVYFASTLSNAANQEIYAISTSNLAGLDFTIISENSGGNIRNISKISAIVLGNTVNYNETSTLAINGYTGDFSVVYNAGNILTGPQVQLLFSPQSSNLTTHKMMITTLKQKRKTRIHGLVFTMMLITVQILLLQDQTQQNHLNIWAIQVKL